MLSRILLAILTGLLLTTCTKTEYKSTGSIFPNATGNTWLYRYYPNNDTIPKQIRVTITGDKVLSTGAKAKVWVYEFPGGINDTLYAVAVKEKVAFFTKDNVERFRFEFPLEHSKSWNSQGFMQVTMITTIYVPAGIFEKTYVITSSKPATATTVLNNEIWFTPGVGIIKYEQHELNPDPAPGNGSWLLDSYSIQ